LEDALYVLRAFRSAWQHPEAACSGRAIGEAGSEWSPVSEERTSLQPWRRPPVQ